MSDFLLEIGTEEIPARMIDGAREELARRTSDLLHRERLAETPAIESFSTPRRLAVLVRNIAALQPDVSEQLTGPSLKVAYKDGVPTPAAEAFARKAGVPVAALEKISTPKGEYLAATVQKKGRAAGEILAELLPKEIAGIYWAKSMYWRGKTAERFVRPVRWMVSLLDGEVVPVEFAGIPAGQHQRRPSHSLRRRGRNRPARELRRRACQEFRRRHLRRARASHSQGPRCCHAHRSRRALARRQVAARHGRQSHRISFGDSRQLRSRISHAAGRSAGHGDARPPEVFRARRCRRQAARRTFSPC